MRMFNRHGEKADVYIYTQNLIYNLQYDSLPDLSRLCDGSKVPQRFVYDARL